MCVALAVYWRVAGEFQVCEQVYCKLALSQCTGVRGQAFHFRKFLPGCMQFESTSSQSEATSFCVTLRKQQRPGIAKNGANKTSNKPNMLLLNSTIACTPAI